MSAWPYLAKVTSEGYLSGAMVLRPQWGWEWGWSFRRQGLALVPVKGEAYWGGKGLDWEVGVYGAQVLYGIASYRAQGTLGREKGQPGVQSIRHIAGRGGTWGA
jgi:hypothetical protein